MLHRSSPIRRRLCASLFAATALFSTSAHALMQACPLNSTVTAPPAHSASILSASPLLPAAAHTIDSGDTPAALPGQLIVIGFMGGNVSATNLAHREALVAQDLQKRNPNSVYAEVFANGDKKSALNDLLVLLDRNHDGCLSPQEKSAARIVIFGHSWGASEAITLARHLNDMGIPVLLTVQVDSVEKLNEDDYTIPPNVHEAINFYQDEGLLHGRAVIVAADPKLTTILGNFKSSYKYSRVSVTEFPWFARAFMHSHIEIENDPVLWARITALIQTKVL